MTLLDLDKKKNFAIKSKRAEIVRRKSFKHTSRVKFFKRFLPFLCFVAIGLIIAWPFIHKQIQTHDFAIPDEHKSIVKKNKVLRPRINSLDKNGQPFTIEALSGEHHNSNVTSFQQPQSVFKSYDNNNVSASSQQATYNKADNKINYQGNVTVKFEQGYCIKTSQADYSITDKKVVGEKNIDATSASCAIRADQGFDANDVDINFKGKVVLDIADRGLQETDRHASAVNLNLKN